MLAVLTSYHEAGRKSLLLQSKTILPTPAQIWWTNYSFFSLQQTFSQDSGSILKLKRRKLSWREKSLNGTELWGQNSWMLFIQNKQTDLGGKALWVTEGMSGGNSKESERNKIQDLMKQLEKWIMWEQVKQVLPEQEQRHAGTLKPLLEVSCPL